MQKNKNFYNRIYQFNVDKIGKILSYNVLDDIAAIIYYVNIHNFHYYIDFLNKQHDYMEVVYSKSVFYLFHYDNTNKFFFNVELNNNLNKYTFFETFLCFKVP